MEYIEREALLCEYDREHQGPPGKARKLIEEAPAADVVPAGGLTERAKDLIKLMPWAVNMLAEKIDSALESMMNIGTEKNGGDE